MKEKHPIDDLFNDKLHDFSLESPMHLWDKVAAATADPAPPKRRMIAWYWLFSAGMLLLALGIWFWNPFSESAIDLDHFPIALEKQAIPQIAEKVGFEVREESSLSKLEATGIVEQTPESKAISAPDQTLPKLASKASLSSEDRVQLTSGGSLEGGASATQTLASIKEKAAIAAADQTENIEIPVSNSLDMETAAPFEMALLGSKSFLLEVPNMDGPLECARFQKKLWATTAGFMASMDYAIRQVEAKDSDFGGYAKLRNDSETFRHGFSVGMRFSTISETGFAVRSGLNYSQINEQLNFKIKEEEQLTVTTKYDTDGSIIGADTSINLIETFRVVNNRYTELDIPLLLGYEIIGDKFSFSVNGGAFINMLASQKGEFVSPNTNKLVSFASNDPNAYRAFKNRIGIGLYGSMGFYFQFGEDMQVLFEPYVKWRPGSISAEGYIVDQRYLTTGLFVGIRKHIL